MTSLTSSAPLAPIAYPRVSGDNESNALPPPPPLDPKHDPTTDPENKNSVDENQVVDSKEHQDEPTDQEPLARSAIRLPLCSRLTPTPLRLSPSRPRTFPTSSTK